MGNRRSFIKPLKSDLAQDQPDSTEVCKADQATQDQPRKADQATQDQPRKAGQATQDQPRKADQATQDQPRKADQATQDQPRKADQPIIDDLALPKPARSKRQPYENKGRHTIKPKDGQAFPDQAQIEQALRAIVPPYMARRVKRWDIDQDGIKFRWRSFFCLAY